MEILTVRPKTGVQRLSSRSPQVMSSNTPLDLQQQSKPPISHKVRVLFLDIYVIPV